MFGSELPVVFESGGKEYPFHSDFREWIRFESLIANSDVPENLRDVLALRLVFAGEIPEDIAGAQHFMLWFYHGGRIPQAVEQSESLESRRVYDFEYDFEYVYAAFLERYNVDLVDVPYLHWWKFRAMFKGLHDCRMTDIMGYRGTEVTDDMPDSYKAFLLDMQDLYELPVSLTERRRIDRARRFLEG